MADISASEISGGGHKAEDAPKDKPADTATTGPIRFKRNYFMLTPNTTGADVPAAEGKDKKKKGKEKEAEKPKPSELFSFSDQTRTDFTKLLDNLVTNVDFASGAGGGSDIFKFNPVAKDLLGLIGPHAETEEEHKALKANIDNVLNQAGGWVATRMLLDQSTTEGLFVLGLVSSAELSEKTTNPKDLIPVKEPTKVRRLDRIRGKKLAKTGMAAAGGGVAWGSVMGGNKLLVETGFAGFIGNTAVDAGQFLAGMDQPSIMALTAAVGGALVGRYLGKEPKPVEIGKHEAGFEAAKMALDAVKGNKEYAAYLKATWKVDVNDFDWDEATQSIKNIARTKTTNQTEAVLDGVRSNLVTRDRYLDDLGVPPEARDIMCEQFIIKNDPTGYERTGERYKADIQERYVALGGGEDPPDIWGNKPKKPDGTPNPYYRRLKTDKDGAPIEVPKIENFTTDPWGQGPDSLWYFRSNGTGIDLPKFDPANLKPREFTRTIRTKGAIRTHEIKVQEPVPDKWGQSAKLPDGSANPFYGRVDGHAVPMKGGSTRDILADLIKGPDKTHLKPKAGAVDKWGQKEGDPGFGRERKQGRFTHKEKLAKFDEGKINFAGIPDSLGQEPGTLYYGTGIEGLYASPPEVNPLALPNGVSAPDIWGQPPGNLFHGRMDARLALPEARLTDFDLNPLALRPKDGTKDKWGQSPTNKDGTPNIFYGRENQGVGTPGEIPYPDADGPVDADGKDEWGQKARYADGTINPFFRRVDEKNDFELFDSTNFADENIVDIWGQTLLNKDGSYNLYCGRFDRKLLPNFSLDNFNKADLVDTWGQRYFLPAGTTPNPFFAREKEADLKPFSLDNFDPIDIQDKWGQERRNADGSKNIYFGVMKSADIKYPLSPYSLENFNREDIVDSQGRDMEDPLFGRGRLTYTDSKGKVHDYVMPDINPANVKARDSNGKSPIQAEFWTDTRPLPVPNFELFKLTTGVDEKGREPGHPLFCIDVDQKTHDIANMSRDKWGQTEGAGGSITFGIASETDLYRLDNSNNLELYRQARELVLTEYTERLLQKIEQAPTKSTEVIEQKIKDRTEENGRIIKEKRDKARKEKPEYELTQGILQARLQAIGGYEQAQTTLDEAEAELKKYLSTTFGPGEDVDAALAKIKEAQSETGVGFTININGESKTIRPIRKDRKEAEAQLTRDELNIYDTRKMRGIEQPDKFRERVNRDLQLVRDKHDEIIKEIGEDENILFEVYGAIEALQATIQTQKEALNPEGEATQKRNEAIYGKANDIREMAFRIFDKLPNRKDAPSLLLTGSPSEILDAVNKLYNPSAALSKRVGWEKIDNGNPTNREDILIYAMTLAKAAQNNPDVFKNPNLKKLINGGVDLAEVIKLDNGDLQALLAGKTPPIIIDTVDIPDVKSAVEQFSRRMGIATQDLFEAIDRSIQKVELDAQDVNLDEDVAFLRLTKEAMGRQSAVFGISAEFVSNVSERIPMFRKEGDPDRLQKYSDLSEREKSKYTDAEQKLGTADPDVPTAYFELLNVLFEYKGKSDAEERFTKISEVLSVRELEDILTDISVDPFKGDSLEDILLRLQDNIRKGLVTRRAVRKMFEGVIEDFEAQALAMP